MLIKAFKIELIKNNEEQSRENSITFINFHNLNPSNTLQNENNKPNEKKEFALDNPGDFLKNHQYTDSQAMFSDKNGTKKPTLFKFVKNKPNEKKKTTKKRFFHI